MKKLALGLVFVAFSSGVFAQTETAGAAGTTVVTTSTLPITAGVLAATAVAAGAKSKSTTSH